MSCDLLIKSKKNPFLTVCEIVESKNPYEVGVLSYLLASLSRQVKYQNAQERNKDSGKYQVDCIK